MNETLRIAMLGKVEGNGHPYSWSAIVNGRYDEPTMSRYAHPAISEYLGHSRDQLGIDGAAVTHVWCDDPAEAQHIAKAAHVPNIVGDPTDVIGHVDAVIIPTDKGDEHVDRARPFIEAGLPVFIDKPMADNVADLRQFIAWQAAGHKILSTSGLRYAREYADLRDRIGEVGELRLIVHTMMKDWERYGIHALEGVYPFLEPGGFLSVANTGTYEHAIVHVRHASGVEIVLPVIKDMVGGYAQMSVYGTTGLMQAHFGDTFYGFKAQLVAFIDYLRTGELPFEFAQTVELMKIIIAGIRSRNEGGRHVALTEIDVGAD